MRYKFNVNLNVRLQARQQSPVAGVLDEPSSRQLTLLSGVAEQARQST
jgi:hypothetical protein